jgi:hypothetical protein
MTAALEGGEWSAARPGRTVPPGKTRYPFYNFWNTCLPKWPKVSEVVAPQKEEEEEEKKKKKKRRRRSAYPNGQKSLKL